MGTSWTGAKLWMSLRTNIVWMNLAWKFNELNEILLREYAGEVETCS
jgi:hypothetical protein